MTTTDTAASNIDDLISRQEKFINKIEYVVIKDRKDAIKTAIKNSEEKDVIFISGRGNREIMCDSYNTITLFNDFEVTKEIIDSNMEDI